MMLDLTTMIIIIIDIASYYSMTFNNEIIDLYIS